MDVDQIWRFELVRGFSKDVHRGACLLTAIIWLVDGKRNDRPASVCSLLAQCGRQVNDILSDDDRQRLKISSADLQVARIVRPRSDAHAFSWAW
jgi:hypothetical protein